MERSLLKKGLIHLPTLLTGNLTNNCHMLIMFLIVLNTNQQTAVRESVNCWDYGSLGIMDLWALWYYGDAARNIKPYRLISSDEIEDKNTKTQLTRARKVIQSLDDIAVLKGYISNKQRILSLEYIDSIDIFHKSFETLVRSDTQPPLATTITKNKRPLELSFCSIYDKYVKKGRHDDVLEVDSMIVYIAAAVTYSVLPLQLLLSYNITCWLCI